MKLSTKTVASLLVVTSIAAAVPGISRIITPTKKHESQFDRLFKRHDRKGEIQADVLGMSPVAFRTAVKRYGLDGVLARAGFKSKREFRLALVGYLRGELKARGWTVRQIDMYVGMKCAKSLA